MLQLARAVHTEWHWPGLPELARWSDQHNTLTTELQLRSVVLLCGAYQRHNAHALLSELAWLCGRFTTGKSLYAAAVAPSLQDPLQAVAAAKGHKARQAATAAANALTHQATAVAVTPCKVLMVSATDLRRFGRRVRGPLALLATERRDFLQHRRSAVQVGAAQQRV